MASLSKRRKSDYKRSGLDHMQISKLNRLSIINRDYANAKHGNTTCIAWQHFGYLVAWNESISDVEVNTAIKKSSRSAVMHAEVQSEASASTNSTSSSSTATTAVAATAATVPPSVTNCLMEGQDII